MESSLSKGQIAARESAQAAGLSFILVFSLGLFFSALLLFLVQPLIGKVLLPKLGGTPQVWTSCMVFFQAMLFAGYLHAHFSSTLLGIRKQALLHMFLAVLALLALPIGISSISSAPDPAHPIPWLAKALLISVGAPLFVISATAPLLQKWVANTNHPSSKDPYFLYAASNAGSLLALLIYPSLIEPNFDLVEQAWWWSAAYVALVMIIGICLAFFYRNYVTVLPHKASESIVPAKLDNATRVRWLLLSFAPSSLLLGVTTFISADIAAVPLFWIVPLALYLVTFIIAFAKKPPVSHEIALRSQAIFLALLTVLLLAPALSPLIVAFPVHLLAFFLTALVCHGELARSRPDSSHLTEFYLWLSLGGVLGGVFNAVLAPALFDRLYEYPIALMLACMLRPRSQSSRKWDRLFDWVLPLAMVAAVATLLPRIVENLPNEEGLASLLPVILVLGIAGIASLKFSERNVRFAVTMGAAYLWFVLGHSIGNYGRLEWTDRSFFGVHRVYKNDSGLNILMHGTTVHGAQFRDAERSMQPLSYYHAKGPFADVFRALDSKLAGKAVAVVGLGAGELTCYGKSTSAWTYYEIDPLVEKLARNPNYFTYLRDCPAKPNIVLGDARLTLRAAADNTYALIIIDAFSSDAIPTHLLTKEAISEYFGKLGPDGVLALHISNRYLRLVPVVGNLAANARLAGRVKRSMVEEKDPFLASASELAVFARKEEHLGEIARDPTWGPLGRDEKSRVWSDDYVNILGAMRIFK